jgi:hypothetical protein
MAHMNRAAELDLAQGTRELFGSRRKALGSPASPVCYDPDITPL